MVVMHQSIQDFDWGLSILNLEEMLQTSQEGEPRYDVEKIKSTHFKRSEYGSFSNCNLIVGDGTQHAMVMVEKELIFVCQAGTTGPNMIMID